MKLDLFAFIDRSIDLLNIKYDHITELNQELEKFFIVEFGDKDNFLAINSRIKSPNSLREKIIRNNLFMHYDRPLDMMFDIQDIVGLRIECRFTDDEVDIYRSIKENFYIPAEDGYYRSPSHKRIFLNLQTPQPMLQKNGFAIYKIDGYIVDGEFKLKFELQIKSLVNVFWGEIDHKVLYKNYNYMLTEDFFQDILHSIKENLSMIDRQLKILYEHVSDMDSSAAINNHVQVKSLLSKIIHDIFMARIKRDLGFVVDLSEISDVTIDYLDYKCRSLLNYNEGENFIRLLNRINTIDQNEFEIGESVIFDRKPVFTTPFSERVGQAVYKIINREFSWNLFFKIIAVIEESDPRLDFEEFFRYMEVFLKNKIKEEIDPRGFNGIEYARLEEFILNSFAKSIEEEPTFENAILRCFNISPKTLSQFFRNIHSYEDFEKNKDRIERMLRSH